MRVIAILAVLLMAFSAAADDGPMFRKNVSKTPDLETEHAAIRMLPVYVPAQASDGTLLTEGIEYYNADGALVETRLEARPLITHYNDGHVDFIEEEGYGGFPRCLGGGQPGRRSHLEPHQSLPVRQPLVH